MPAGDFIVDRDFLAAGAIGQHQHHHAALLRLLEPHGVDHPRDDRELATVVRGGWREACQRRAHDLLELARIRHERMAAQVEPERRTLVLQLLADVPGRCVGQRRWGLRRPAGATEQTALVGIARGLLGRPHGDAHRCQEARTIVVDTVESPGLDQRFDHPAVHQPPLDARAEVEQIAERPILIARPQNARDGRLTGALDRAQPVADADGIDRHEPVVAGVHVGRQYLQAVRLGVVVELLQLVGVAHERRQVGGHECCGVVRLEIRGVIGHQRIGGRVRLVEAVAGELLHVIEDLVRLGRLDAPAGGTVDEDRALLRHLLGLLLAHRAPQQVGAAERIAGADLRRLHHLLLVHHDPVGGLEHRHQRRMQVVEALALLALDVVGYQLHRPRAVQGHERDDVLEAVGPRPGEQLAHAARFELEHGRGVAGGEDAIGLAIIERQRLELQRRCGVEQADEAQCPVEDGERGQAEEVELHQPDGLDIVLVELRHRTVRTGREVERAEIGELAGRDQHPARVHADVARDTFELRRERQQVARLLVFLFELAQPRFHLARHLERDELAWLERDQLGQLVGAAIAPFHHPTHVAHHRLGRHGAEGHDLRYRLVAVAAAHVVDHPVAALLAEVDVEVGHRHAFRIQEALEQQVVA